MDSRNLLKILTGMKLKQSGGILPVGGYSMIPLLVAGDNVRLEERENYSIGDIIICIDQRARLLVHRIIDIENGENEPIYITKGDNAVAAERIERSYCMGKVVEAANRSGKMLKFGEPTEKDLQIVKYSRKVNEIYNDTRDPNEAYSSEYNARIYEMAPDDIKEYVYKAQEYMIQKACEYITGRNEPQDETFVYTRDFYSMLVNHRVVNVLSPYFTEECGRFSKMFKLTKARNFTAARQRIEWSRKITAAFEDAGIAYVVYKGITVSYFAYGDPIMRECDDIDFLIAPKYVQKAHDIMIKLGFAQAGHDYENHIEEKPLMEYPTHLAPYVIPGTGITAELHTALYITEDHTEEILSRRHRIDVGDYEFYALSDVDLYICQLYTTAVDDFGCANMTYEDDPNIFLQLKFRNYLDIVLLTRKLTDISGEYLIELARRYDICFYLYLALDYTCKIFEPADFIGKISDLRDLIKESEDIDESFYMLPIDARSCLQSPFKMKMNGAALVRLRDAFYMSRRWRVQKAIFDAGEYEELRQGNELEFSTGLGSIRYANNELIFRTRMDMPESGEFMVTVRRMSDHKYRKPGDYCLEAKFLYCNMNNNTAAEGILYTEDELPWEKRIEIICGIIKTGINKTNLRVRIDRVDQNIQFVEETKIDTTCNLLINHENLKQKFKFEYISGRVFELKEDKVLKVHRTTMDCDEHLKISFD